MATQTVLARWKTVDPALARVHRDRVQAEADDAFVNAPLIERMKRMSSLAWAILLLAIMGVVAIVSHLPNPKPALPKPVAPVAAQPAMERFDPPQMFRVAPGRGVRMVNVRQAAADVSAVLDRIDAGSSIQAAGRVRTGGGGSWIAYQRGDGTLAYVAESLLRPEPQPDASKPDDGCAAKPWALRRMCEDPQVKRLDDTLTTSYRRALDAATPADRGALISGERQWIARRDGCERQTAPNSCLVEAYRSRTAELDQATATAAPAPTEQAPTPGPTNLLPQAQPASQGSPPQPKGDPSLLISADDYPPPALRAGEAGRVVVRLHVTAYGAIDGCDVSASSGFADLDETTCRLLTMRARYSPARDASGAATDAFVSKAVDWTIPQ